MKVNPDQMNFHKLSIKYSIKKAFVTWNSEVGSKNFRPMPMSKLHVSVIKTIILAGEL